MHPNAGLGPGASQGGDPEAPLTAADPATRAAPAGDADPSKPGAADAQGSEPSTAPAVSPESKARLLDHLERLTAMHATRKEWRNAPDEEKEKSERTWQEIVAGLQRLVRGNPDRARILRDEMDLVEDEKLALRLARILQQNEDPEFVAEMRSRVSGGATPMMRRTAIVNLEHRPLEVWQEPVTKAYRSDPDGLVRDQAAEFLGRSLADRQYVTAHVEVRSSILEGLGSEEPAQRARALFALMADRTADPATVERVAAMRDDPDPKVQEAARRTYRILKPRLDRLREAAGR